MKDREYLVLLSTFVPFGPARISLLLKYFGSAKKIWNASDKKIRELGLGEKLVQSFLKHRGSLNKTQYFNRLNREKVQTITILDSDYPENLENIATAPRVLYVKGTLKVQDKNAVAIVGSRKMTSYGREVTEKFANKLARVGVTIVSGLARGIDTSAHKSAVEVGRTIAVLGCGLDKVYPPENTNLANEIVKKGSALISEYPLGYPALPMNFASRNRIISGLSKAVLVVEGRAKSGTLLTASAAADQGRDVFAVPGQITSPGSEAPHFLIQNGAKIAMSVSDILLELDLSFKQDKAEIERVMPASSEESEILEILAMEPLHLDEIVRISSIDTGVISARLAIMEIKGLVKNMGGGVYKKI